MTAIAKKPQRQSQATSHEVKFEAVRLMSKDGKINRCIGVGVNQATTTNKKKKRSRLHRKVDLTELLLMLRL